MTAESDTPICNELASVLDVTEESDAHDAEEWARLARQLERETVALANTVLAVERDRDWWRDEAERLAAIVTATDKELERRGIGLSVTLGAALKEAEGE